MNPILKLKKKQQIVYRHDKQSLVTYPPHTSNHRLQVLYKAKLLGDLYIVRCKVLTKGWYSEVYITEKDFSAGRITL